MLPERSKDDVDFERVAGRAAEGLPDDLLGEAGLMKELKICLMERMLGAGLIAHLGYEAVAEAQPEQSSRRNGI